MTFNPFDKVDCKYGSPMGRPSDAPGHFVDVPRGSLKAVHEHDSALPGEVEPGYDKGGAYWGLPDDVWAVWIDDPNEDRAVTYVRARSAEEAIDKVRGIELDAFTNAYIEAIYFTDGQGIDGDEFGPDAMLSAFAARSIKADCDRFRRQNADLLAKAYRNGYDRAQAGHDFWLTRNGHGTGFWDRKELDALSTINATLGDRLTAAAEQFGSVSPYLGDDGFIHLGGG